MLTFGRRRILQALRAAGVEVRRPSRGALLLVRSQVARRHWQDVERSLGRFLADEHVAALLELYAVNCVIDVGANRGQYAAGLRRAGYRGHIVSFEPVPEVFEQLRRRAAADRLWVVHPYALGREEGSTTMNVVPGTLSSVLAPSRFGARRYAQLRAPARQEVPIRRLDTVLDTLLADIADPRPFLKLDTQGFDLEVFAGLGERTGDFVGMQAEVALLQIYEGMPRMAQALAVYEAAGFEITGLYPVSRQRRTARVLEFDCVMARAAAR